MKLMHKNALAIKDRGASYIILFIFLALIMPQTAHRLHNPSNIKADFLHLIAKNPVFVRLNSATGQNPAPATLMDDEQNQYKQAPSQCCTPANQYKRARSVAS